MTSHTSLRCILDFGWLFILLAIFYHFWEQKRTLLYAKGWLKTKGHITRCEWTKIGTSIWPKIEYTYQVHDKDIIGQYLFLDTTHNNPNSTYSRNIAYKAAVAFAENNEIEVYYNPNHPEQSALDTTVPIKLNIILLLVSVFIIVHSTVIIYRCLA